MKKNISDCHFILVFSAYLYYIVCDEKVTYINRR